MSVLNSTAAFEQAITVVSDILRGNAVDDPMVGWASARACAHQIVDALGVGQPDPEMERLRTELEGSKQAFRELLTTAEGMQGDRERAAEADRWRIAYGDLEAAAREVVKQLRNVPRAWQLYYAILDLRAVLSHDDETPQPEAEPEPVGLQESQIQEEIADDHTWIADEHRRVHPMKRYGTAP